MSVDADSSLESPGSPIDSETVSSIASDDVPTALTDPADGVPAVISTSADLEICAESLAAGSGPIAVDAERAGGYRYGHKAYLVQIRREGSGTHLIDPTQVESLGTVANAISDAEWILHAASQDLPCLAELDMAPTQLFDTEVAARILGRPKVGLAALAESELGLSLAKAHSAADWSTRPLPADWLRYAALDVELLCELRDILAADLTRLGRLEWAHEEFEFVRLAPAKAQRSEPWRRTSGMHRVRTPKGLAVVRQLWLARDELAETRDIAPGRVLPDASITAAAVALPEDQAALAAMSEFSGRGTKRRIAYWWTAVEKGMNTAPTDLPSTQVAPTGPPPPRSWPDRSPPAAARLAAARSSLNDLREKLGIPTENILSPDSVRRLCWDPPEPSSRAAVEDFLTSRGARKWQIDLTADLLTEALKATPEPS